MIPQTCMIVINFVVFLVHDITNHLLLLLLLSVFGVFCQYCYLHNLTHKNILELNIWQVPSNCCIGNVLQGLDVQHEKFFMCHVLDPQKYMTVCEYMTMYIFSFANEICISFMTNMTLLQGNFRFQSLLKIKVCFHQFVYLGSIKPISILLGLMLQLSS